MAYWAAFFLVLIVGFAIELFLGRRWWRLVWVTVVATLIFGGVIAADYYWRTLDQEVWSGSITGWEHKEEWDEWIPGKEDCETDSHGRKSCTKDRGHWEHHEAKNKIQTSDNGWMTVDESLDGKVDFNDRFPNSTADLAKYFPLGMPSASTHIYTNKVKGSYSLFKHTELDPKDYTDLPSYPGYVRDLIKVDRIVGAVPNKDRALDILAAWNTKLNKDIPDPDHPGKTRSWKQVNLIFVNVGTDKPREYGYALQDRWQNGNKNDFIVSFSPALDGTMKWVYAFSWSEVDILKLEVQDYLSEMGFGKDFAPIVDHVAQMVADKFERKQFAEFSYLQIEPSNTSTIIIWVLELMLLAFYGYKAIRSYMRGRGRSSYDRGFEY
ncbi:hypothetical protein GCM10008018_49200 [Paenibacillus marchantiophytorum]|uniref:Uncharacterized protein n=1 Tax=Paenibacillus marchantiophytorum TaxID=1619310 RepID=A0ABQ1F233_9BACL|nr:hypothetical protein [Paenibacillus marchantiophytorum]GFZ96989.1 hypothetical protein GCM10008018_49200 [Paenibacillus marchantiophytorum]